MPYLNCVEKCDQNFLVKHLPKLYNDLRQSKMDTLSDFHVEWTHVNMKAHAPSTELDNYLLSEMSLEAASGIELEYSVQGAVYSVLVDGYRWSDYTCNGNPQTNTEVAKTFTNE